MRGARAGKVRSRGCGWRGAQEREVEDEGIGERRRARVRAGEKKEDAGERKEKEGEGRICDLTKTEEGGCKVQGVGKEKHQGKP